MTSGVIPLTDLHQRCLDYVTFYYETGKASPDCYGVTAGNFDGSGISHGIIQFNFGSGTLQPIWRDLINNHPDVVAQAITTTTDYNTFVDVVLNRTTADQIAWGNSVTDPANQHQLLQPWATYFNNLGMTPESQARQNQACQPYFDSANTWKGDYSLWTRRGYALCFDIAVQSGSISTAVHDLIMSDFANINLNDSRESIEVQKMQIIANRRADAVSSTYQASYRDRKLAIANGEGTVYGGATTTVPYDLILEPAYNTDVLTVAQGGQAEQWILINHNLIGI
jgi:hypothetical protein